MRGERTPAVVIAGEMIALAVARSLSRAAVPVHALGHGEDPLRHSRSRVEFVDVGAGDELQRRSLEWLERVGPRGAVVLPCDDEALELVAHHRPHLVELGYRPQEADDEVVLTMLDKERTYQLCDRIGIDRPRTMIAENFSDALEFAQRVGYPCAVKPREAHLWRRHFTLRTKALIATGPAELERAMARIEPLGLKVIMTELIPGPDRLLCSYYSYLDADGRPLLHVTKNKPRQLPPGFGLGTYQVMDRNPELAEVGLRFFTGAGMRGLAMVEFKRDPRDGRLKLIECNPRFSASTGLIVAAGVDLPVFCYSRVLGLPTPPINGYRIGLSQWSPLADTRAMLEYRRRGELTLGSWLRSVLRRHQFPIASLTDPLPSLVALARKLRSRALRLTGRSA